MALGERVGARTEVRVDVPLMVAVGAITATGLVNLYSATSVYVGTERQGIADFYVSQIYWIAIGSLLGGVLAVLDYRIFERVAYYAYAIGLSLLGLVFVVGKSLKGAVRWIQIGSFNFQPSEFMKIVVILTIAKYLHNDPKTEPRTLFDLVPAAALVSIPVVAVMEQPDLGTALIYVFISGAMLSLTRLKRSSVMGLVAAVAVIVPFAWNYLLRDYQKARVTSFLDPESHKTGSGWHAFQSITAVGNGGFWGEGFRQGTQNQFGFLPEQFSDFPFAVFAEDWGFVGCATLIAVYGFVAIWAIYVASEAKDRFGAVLSVGVGAMFFVHAFFNIGMATGVLPVVGITLPLFSYGGSSVLTMFMGLGLLMSVSMRR